MRTEELKEKLVKYFADEFHCWQIGQSIFNDNPHHQANRFEAMRDLMTEIMTHDEFSKILKTVNSQNS